MGDKHKIRVRRCDICDVAWQQTASELKQHASEELAKQAIKNRKETTR